MRLLDRATLFELSSNVVLFVGLPLTLCVSKLVCQLVCVSVGLCVGKFVCK